MGFAEYFSLTGFKCLPINYEEAKSIPAGQALAEWVESKKRNVLSYKANEFLAFFTISSPIARPAVAAGLGAFNTCISRSVVSK